MISTAPKIIYPETTYLFRKAKNATTIATESPLPSIRLDKVDKKCLDWLSGNKLEGSLAFTVSWDTVGLDNLFHSF